MVITVTIALLASLFVALTIIPVLAYWFLKAPKATARFEVRGNKPNLLERGYTPLISWVTKHRVITVIVSVLLLVGSFMLFPLLPSNAFGNQGSSSFNFTITLPKNTTLDRTNQAAQSVENVLSGVLGIQTYQTVV